MKSIKKRCVICKKEFLTYAPLGIKRQRGKRATCLRPVKAKTCSRKCAKGLVLTFNKQYKLRKRGVGKI